MNGWLSGNKISLRALEPEDLDWLFRWENDSALWVYGHTVAPYSRYLLKEYLQNYSSDIYKDGQLRLMIVNNTDDDRLGLIDLFDFDFRNRRASVGILVDSEQQQKGYGTEALELLTRYAFEWLQLHSLNAIVAAPNEASRKLFTRCGFEMIAVLPEWFILDGKYHDAMWLQRIDRKK